MPFPTTTYTTNSAAASGLVSNAAAAGLDLSGLQPMAQLQSAVANLLLSDPSTVNVPAGNILSGTFGANKTGGADTGTYTFPGALAIAGALTGVTTGAFSGAVSTADLTATTGTFSGAVSLTGLMYTTSVASATALATPSAFAATKGAFFASAVSGATLMGFGTTGDVTLKNRAGIDVLVVTANTLNVTMAGALAIAGALSGVTTLAMAGALSGATAITATSVAVTAGLTSSGATGAGIGYAAGAGGTVSQLTDRSTGVTLNTLSGTITGQATSLAAGASASFVVTNSTVAIGDTVSLSVRSGPTASTSVFTVSGVATGSFTIRASNTALVTADTGAPVLNFAIIKAVSA